MKLMSVTAGTVLALALAGAASAQGADNFQVAKAGDWQVTARVTGVLTDASDNIVTAAGTPTGLHVDVSDDVMPTFGFTYFVTDKVSVEAIVGTTEHTIKAVGTGVDVEVHKTWVLPPVVTLQYRPAPDSRVSPYFGAGLNYMLFYGGKDENGFKVKVDNGFGYALQAGADVALKGPWYLNVDAKKVWFDTKASVNGGVLKSDVNLDPWVVSVGIGRKF